MTIRFDVHRLGRALHGDAYVVLPSNTLSYQPPTIRTDGTISRPGAGNSTDQLEIDVERTDRTTLDLIRRF